MVWLFLFSFVSWTNANYKCKARGVARTALNHTESSQQCILLTSRLPTKCIFAIQGTSFPLINFSLRRAIKEIRVRCSCNVCARFSGAIASHSPCAFHLCPLSQQHERDSVSKGMRIDNGFSSQVVQPMSSSQFSVQYQSETEIGFWETTVFDPFYDDIFDFDYRRAFGNSCKLA